MPSAIYIHTYGKTVPLIVSTFAYLIRTPGTLRCSHVALVHTGTSAYPIRTPVTLPAQSRGGTLGANEPPLVPQFGTDQM